MGPAVLLALLAELFDFHLFGDLNRQAPFRRTLVGLSLLKIGSTSLILQLLFFALALQHDALGARYSPRPQIAHSGTQAP